MHELLSHLLALLTSGDPVQPNIQPSPATGNNHDIYTALIIVGGTVLTAVIGLIAASFQRERSPRATVESQERDRVRAEAEEEDRQRRWAQDHEDRQRDREERQRVADQLGAQGVLVRQVMDDMTEDRDNLERDLLAARSLYTKLREACFRSGFDPDELIQENA